jgi:hypothetical protein
MAIPHRPPALSILRIELVVGQFVIAPPFIPHCLRSDVGLLSVQAKTVEGQAIVSPLAIARLPYPHSSADGSNQNQDAILIDINRAGIDFNPHNGIRA